MEPLPDFDRTPRNDVPEVDESPRKLLDTPRPSFRPFEHHQAVVRGNYRTFAITFPADRSCGEFTAGYATAKKMAEQFADSLEEAAQFLYQSKAAPRTIIKTHDALTKSLAEKHRELGEKLSTMNTDAKFIPHMSELRQISSCLTDRFSFLVLEPMRTKEYKKLSLVLGCEEHKTSLEFCKEKKKACKELRHPGNDEDRVQKLEAIFEAAKAKCGEIMAQLEGKPEEVYDQTSKLFEKLFKFIAYTSTFPPKKERPAGWFWGAVSYVWASAVPTYPQNTPHLARQLELLRDKVNIELEALSTLRSKALSQKKVKNIEPAQVDYSLASPRATADFRSGGALERALYSEMSEEVRTLRCVATALAKDLETITSHLVQYKAMPKGQLDLLESRLAAHRQKLQEEQRKLEQLPISSKIQAGWYYVERLEEQARTVEMYCKHLKKLSTPELSLYLQAFSSLIEYLRPDDEALGRDPCYFISQNAVERLYTTLRHAALLNKPAGAKRSALKIAADIFDTVEHTVATVGLRTLNHSSEEKNFSRGILTGVSIASLQDEFDKSNLLHSYLMKGFIHKLYFLDSTKVDTEFEIILNILETDPRYSPVLEQLFRENSLLNELHDDYHKRSDMAQYRHELELMAKIWDTRLPKSPNLTTELFDYARAKQLFCDLASSRLSDQQLCRRNWIELKQPRLPLGYPEYFSRLGQVDMQIDGDLAKLAQNIVVSLFADNPQRRIEATEAIDEGDIPQVPGVYMSLLVQGWRLSQFVLKGKQEPPAHGSPLDSVLTQYISEEHTRELWKDFKGVDFMEHALYLSGKNRGEGHKKWNSILYYYNEYQKKKNDLERLLLQAQNHLTNVDLTSASADTATEAAVFCFSTMFLDYMRAVSSDFYRLLHNPVAAKALFDKLAKTFDYFLSYNVRENRQLQEAQKLYADMQRKILSYLVSQADNVVDDIRVAFRDLMQILNKGDGFIIRPEDETLIEAYNNQIPEADRATYSRIDELMKKALDAHLTYPNNAELKTIFYEMKGHHQLKTLPFLPRKTKE
ncbi:MAG: hypothetical protein JSR37_09965 [Verrucomicrobia bacterium]|nr:hypothetical protein [Verrucomicrobiota bacterium]MBS0637848.1 hypothetical protein [Verrucomicrobiota bacterium]